MTPRTTAPDDGPGAAEPRREPLAQLRLRLPASGCSECRRVAQTALEGLEGVLLVDAQPSGAGITVTYDPGRIDPVDLRSAAQQAGCTST
jgi:copper chaperone CopZ